ncbi:nucleotidyltransferase family protein [Halobacillus litoralis]|uniref:nucleotidyltransferase domain-containing protein n=1 Tax=Halobacillus litoralis TaxID=45668 RepID=UPI001CFF25C1|nr:nucleotidyltransferase family protein [Halobacillus litoralis]WLR49150.1 nucleotidyltransferase family protein [Halobacillus litoralis]
MSKATNLQLANVPKEVHLILQLLKSDKQQDIDALSRSSFEDIDWNLFIKQSLHHRVYPLLYSKVKMVESGRIPEFVEEKLCFEYKRNTFQMLQLSGEMERMSRLFSSNEIRLLFLKGPMLSHELYGDVSLRTSGDLDVMISIEDLQKAEHLLASHGYQKDDYIETVLEDWKWRHHHVTYYHPRKKVKIELHWRLNPGPCKEPGFEHLWKRKEVSSISKTPIYILGKEELFLFLAAHGARHGWSRLRWLVDIDRLVDQSIDWKNLKRLLIHNHFHLAGAQALYLSSVLLETPVPLEMPVNKRSRVLAQQAIFYLESMINLHSEPLPQEVADYHKRHLFSLMSWNQKFFFILSFLYPYPEDAELLPLPKRLHFLYFPLRPFLWGWRKTRKHAIT